MEGRKSECFKPWCHFRTELHCRPWPCRVCENAGLKTRPKLKAHAWGRKWRRSWVRWRRRKPSSSLKREHWLLGSWHRQRGSRQEPGGMWLLLGFCCELSHGRRNFPQEIKSCWRFCPSSSSLRIIDSWLHKRHCGKLSDVWQNLRLRWLQRWLDVRCLGLFKRLWQHDRCRLPLLSRRWCVQTRRFKNRRESYQQLIYSCFIRAQCSLKRSPGNCDLRWQWRIPILQVRNCDCRQWMPYCSRSRCHDCWLRRWKGHDTDARHHNHNHINEMQKSYNHWEQIEEVLRWRRLQCDPKDMLHHHHNHQNCSRITCYSWIPILENSKLLE